MTLDTSMLHAAFGAAAKAAATRLAREGDAGTTGSGAIYQARRDGVLLTVRLAESGGRQLVAEARHRGALDPLLLGVLDVFCQAIEGVPLQEASDHGAIHALERLRADTPRPVAGILTPRSAGSAFVLCERLIRDILAQHQQTTGAAAKQNFWNPPLSAGWMAKSADERIAALRPVVESFLTKHGLGGTDLRITQVEKARRVIVAFGPAVPSSQKPGLLMDLERQIRRTTGDRLELYTEEMKDDNQIRRLGPNEASPS